MKRPRPSRALSLTEVASLHRRAERLKRPAELPRSLELLEEVLEACPTYTPALLLAARRLQSRQGADPGEARAGLRQARDYLRRAVVVSARSAAAMVELGYFLHGVEKAPEAAERTFRAGVDQALGVLEDGWAGLLDVLCERGRLEEARELGARAQALFPDSVRIATALAPALAADLPAPRRATRKPRR